MRATDDLAADRRVKLALKRRRLERLVGRSRPAALGPLGHHIVGLAGVGGQLFAPPSAPPADTERVEECRNIGQADAVLFWIVNPWISRRQLGGMA